MRLGPRVVAFLGFSLAGIMIAADAPPSCLRLFCAPHASSMGFHPKPTRAGLWWFAERESRRLG